MTPTKATPAAEAIEPIPPNTLDLFASMAASIPEGDEDGSMRIVEQVLAATDLGGLNAPWSGANADDLLGVPIRVNDLRRSTSDFAGGLGMYLIVSGHRCDTGEAITYTTGSVSVVAQLARAWALGALPVTATLVQSDRPSKAGYFPQHLVLSNDTEPF